MSVETARLQWEDARARVAELNAELAEVPQQMRYLDWSNEEQASRELTDLERRQDALPHLLRHARKVEAEAEIRFREAELEEAEAKRPELSERIDALQEQYLEVRTELDQARAEFQDLVIGQMSDVRNAKKEAHRRLAAIEREPSPEERGPVVRSSWQKNMGSPGPENYIQDNPALRFGAANLSDTPLSVSEDTPATVVIPQAARKQGGRG